MLGLAHFPSFAELKRSLRERPQLHSFGIDTDGIGLGTGPVVVKLLVDRLVRPGVGTLVPKFADYLVVSGEPGRQGLSGTSEMAGAGAGRRL